MCHVCVGPYRFVLVHAVYVRRRAEAVMPRNVQFIYPSLLEQTWCVLFALVLVAIACVFFSCFYGGVFWSWRFFRVLMVACLWCCGRCDARSGVLGTLATGGVEAADLVSPALPGGVSWSRNRGKALLFFFVCFLNFCCTRILGKESVT